MTLDIRKYEKDQNIIESIEMERKKRVDFLKKIYPSCSIEKYSPMFIQNLYVYVKRKQKEKTGTDIII